MFRSFLSHIRGNTVAYLALFFALSTGAYAAGLGRDSVYSRNLVNGEVKTQDVANDDTADALTGKDIAQDSLDGWDIKGLSFADLQDNTLTGGQIDESSLAMVPAAAQGGTGRYGFEGDCDPDSSDYEWCSVAGVPHSRPGRLLIIGDVVAETDRVGGGWGAGNCRLRVDDKPIDASTTYLDFHTDNHNWVGTRTNQTLIAVSDVEPAGNQTIGIECNEDRERGDDGLRIPQARIVGVALSDG